MQCGTERTRQCSAVEEYTVPLWYHRVRSVPMETANGERRAQGNLMMSLGGNVTVVSHLMDFSSPWWCCIQVYAQMETTDEETRVERNLLMALRRLGAAERTSQAGQAEEGSGAARRETPVLELVWGSTMYHLEDLPFAPSPGCPDIYTQFRKVRERRQSFGGLQLSYRACTSLPVHETVFWCITALEMPAFNPVLSTFGGCWGGNVKDGLCFELRQYSTVPSVPCPFACVGSLWSRGVSPAKCCECPQGCLHSCPQLSWRQWEGWGICRTWPRTWECSRRSRTPGGCSSLLGERQLRWHASRTTSGPRSAHASVKDSTVHAADAVLQ